MLRKLINRHSMELEIVDGKDPLFLGIEGKARRVSGWRMTFWIMLMIIVGSLLQDGFILKKVKAFGKEYLI